jgi:anti-sigma regulatory factor (Ser/Thr protein kinase)
MFAASVARIVGVAEDTIEDVKLAVSEACSSLVDPEAADPGELSLEAVHQDGRLTFEAAGTRGALALPPDQEGDTPTPVDLVAELRFELVEALFRGSEVTTGPDGATVIRFAVPTG